MTLQTINPTTGETIRAVEPWAAAQLEPAAASAYHEFQNWRQVPLGDRILKIENVSRLLRENKEDYASMITKEMGKPISQARGEIEKCAWLCDYYKEQAPKFLADQNVATDASKSYISFQPLGVIVAVMPWNFPFWQVFRPVVPALIAGNAVLMKHAANVQGCAGLIEQIFLQAGFPEGLFQNLPIGHELVSELLEDPRVRAVTLTGSSQAGRSIAEKAGAMLKKAVLELGGSDPYVIFEDADLDVVVPICVLSRLINSGQSCIAAKRFIVIQSIKEEFEKRLSKEMLEQKIGDPMDETVKIGPLARHDLRDALHEQVVESVRQGAKLMVGGVIPDVSGAFYPPTVLTDVARGMPAYEEEMFGPVASIIEAANETEAVRLANDSSFGLGAAIFTSDVKRGEQIARDEFEAGACFVNSYVKSDPRLPFGGIKDSGYGRELGPFGILEFVNIKSVYIK